MKHHPSIVHIKTVEEIVANYLKNYHEDAASRAANAALPANKKKNAKTKINIDPTIQLT